jgi:hypothetical protein
MELAFSLVAIVVLIGEFARAIIVELPVHSCNLMVDQAQGALPVPDA